MTHKCFLNNKRNLQKRFIASGLIAVFSNSLFSGYTGAAMYLFPQSYTFDLDSIQNKGADEEKNAEISVFINNNYVAISRLFSGDIFINSLKDIFSMDNIKIKELWKNRGAQIKEEVPSRDEFIFSFFRYLKDKGCPLIPNLINYFSKNKISFQNAIRDVFEECLHHFYEDIIKVAGRVSQEFRQRYNKNYLDDLKPRDRKSKRSSKVRYVVLFVAILFFMYYLVEMLNREKQRITANNSEKDNKKRSDIEKWDNTKYSSTKQFSKIGSIILTDVSAVTTTSGIGGIVACVGRKISNHSKSKKLETNSNIKKEKACKDDIHVKKNIKEIPDIVNRNKNANKKFAKANSEKISRKPIDLKISK